MNSNGWYHVSLPTSVVHAGLELYAGVNEYSGCGVHHAGAEQFGRCRARLVSMPTLMSLSFYRMVLVSYCIVVYILNGYPGLV